MSMDSDRVAQAIKDAFAVSPKPGALVNNAGEALNEIANQLTRIADALEHLVEIELYEDEDEEDA